MHDQGQAIAQIRVEIDPKQPTNKLEFKFNEAWEKED